jgi:hypothetical protein
MARDLAGNIQAATGVTIAIRDTESFQGEVEGREKRHSVSSEQVERVVSREGEFWWAAQGGQGIRSLAEQERRFCGGRRLKACQGLARTGEASTVGSSGRDNKTDIEPTQVSVSRICRSLLCHFLPCSCD